MDLHDNILNEILGVRIESFLHKRFYRHTHRGFSMFFSTINPHLIVCAVFAATQIGTGIAAVLSGLQLDIVPIDSNFGAEGKMMRFSLR